MITPLPTGNFGSGLSLLPVTELSVSCIGLFILFVLVMIFIFDMVELITKYVKKSENDSKPLRLFIFNHFTYLKKNGRLVRQDDQLVRQDDQLVHQDDQLVRQDDQLVHQDDLQQIEYRILLILEKNNFKNFKTHCIIEWHILSNIILQLKIDSFEKGKRDILIVLMGLEDETSKTKNYLEFDIPTSSTSSELSTIHKIDKDVTILFNLHPENTHTLHIEENFVLLIAMRSNYS